MVPEDEMQPTFVSKLKLVTTLILIARQRLVFFVLEKY